MGFFLLGGGSSGEQFPVGEVSVLLVVALRILVVVASRLMVSEDLGNPNPDESSSELRK